MNDIKISIEAKLKKSNSQERNKNQERKKHQEEPNTKKEPKTKKQPKLKITTPKTDTKDKIRRFHIR
jgi:hypothetical protein